MDFGILRALQTLKNHPYVQYVGLGFAGLVQAGSENDQEAQGRQRKTKMQLIRLSAAVCGIELCYAAETAFVSPILLKLGVPVSLMTLVWCLSPVLGFFLVPVMGSLSDRCPLAMGRRRPFIMVMSVGIVCGLVLVPNGEALGLWMGDNGTVTLHHPKYFAPLNSTPTGEKRSPPFPSPWNNPSHDTPPNDFPAKITSMESFLYTTFGDSRNLSKSYNDGNASQWYDTDGTKQSINYRFRSVDKTDLLEIARPKRNIRHGNKKHNSSRIVKQKNRKSNADSEQNTNVDVDDEAGEESQPIFQLSEEHFRGIILTIVGVALLDFNCDACQSPCRAYLLDVSIPEDHSSGLTMFTVMAGLGGAVGYVMGGIDWNSTSFGEAFGGHIRVVFTLVIVVFLACVASTVTSFRETPLRELGYNKEDLQRKKKKVGKSKYRKFTNDDSDEELEGQTIDDSFPARYGALTNSRNDEQWCGTDSVTPHLSETNQTGDDTVNFYHAHDPSFAQAFNGRPSSTDTPEADRSISAVNGLRSHTKTPDNAPAANMWSQQSQANRGDTALNIQPPAPIQISTDVTLKTYLRSIIDMPRCMWVLCLVNLFCWMSLVCYSLYFTDFVGQAVFMGDPQAPPGSKAHNAYDDGVRLGSFGMSLYSLSCSVYSLLIEKLVKRYRAKSVYVTGQLVFTVGMAVMAAARNKVAVVLLSPAAGIMYATLFTMPYLLVAHYHTSGLTNTKQVRGLGTDVAIISSMVFLAQFLLSVAMGTIIYAFSSTTTVIIASSVLSCLGALTATQVTYIDL